MKREVRRLHFRQQNIDLASGERDEISFLCRAPGPGRDDGEPGRTRADGKFALPLLGKTPDRGKSMAPALVLIARSAVQKRMIDGIKIALQFEPVRKGFAKSYPDVHDRDLDDVLIHALVAVLLYSYVPRGLAVFDDVLTDLGQCHDKTVDGPVVISKMCYKYCLSAVSYLSDDVVDIVGVLNRGDFEQDVGIGAAKIFFRIVGRRIVKGEATFRKGKEVHPVEVCAHLGRFRENDAFPHILKQAKLADFEERQHAVGIDKGNCAEVYLFRANKGFEGLFEGIFGYLVHREE